MDVPAGVTQEEGHTGFLHLPSAVLALNFLARRIQQFLSLVDRYVEFCVLDNRVSLKAIDHQTDATRCVYPSNVFLEPTDE